MFDWTPINKPKSGKEEEFEHLFQLLTGISEDPAYDLSDETVANQMLEKFWDISISPAESLHAPMVGKDPEADQWVIELYIMQKDMSKPMDEFQEQLKGSYVLDLVPECDGLPVYISPKGDSYSFYAGLLEACADIIDPDTYGLFSLTQTAEEVVELGDKLMSIAENYAEKNNCLALKKERVLPSIDKNSVEYKSHLLYAAAKWLQFWGNKGHGIEAGE